MLSIWISSKIDLVKMLHIITFRCDVSTKKQRLNTTSARIYRLKEISVPLFAAVSLKMQALIANTPTNRNIFAVETILNGITQKTNTCLLKKKSVLIRAEDGCGLK